MKKNTYYVCLWNDSTVFDSAEFTNIAKAKKWAAGRGCNYHTEIRVNDEEEPSIVYINR